MMPLYFYLLLASVSIPFLFSLLHTAFIKEWKYFAISTGIVAIVFLIWDAIFTNNGVWGFNHNYVLGPHILKMPIEEWLFFIIIPFCSLFIHFALDSVKPNFGLGKKTTQIISLILITVSLSIAIYNSDKAYTGINFTFLFIVLAIGYYFDLASLQKFYISFLIILIPFLIVNGILTGFITDEPIVWYNNNENLGIRIGTIPVEDFGYAFSMLFANLMIFEKLKSNKNVSTSQEN